MQLWFFYYKRARCLDARWTLLKDCAVTPYHRMLTSPLEGDVKNCNKPFIYVGFCGIYRGDKARPPLPEEKTWEANHRNVNSTGKGPWSEIRFIRAGLRLEAKDTFEHVFQESKINIFYFLHYCPINYTFYYTYLPANGVQKHGFSLQMGEFKSV